MRESTMGGIREESSTHDIRMRRRIKLRNADPNDDFGLSLA